MYIPPQILGCSCDACCEAGCSIDLTGRSKIIHVLDLNCVRTARRLGGKIADCAFLWKEKNIFAIVELKGGLTKVSIDKVTKQIQGGINALNDLMGDQKIEDIYPIYMYAGKDPTAALKGKLVGVRGITRRIIPLKCGERLSSIV